MAFLQQLLDWITNNKGTFLGIVIGLVVAILFLTIGFWQTVLIAICVGIGAFLGANPNVRIFLKEWFKNLFNKRS